MFGTESYGFQTLFHFDEGIDGQLLNERDLGSGRWNDGFHYVVVNFCRSC